MSHALIATVACPAGFSTAGGHCLPVNLPGGSDIIGLLPELIVGGGFLMLMLLDLVVPARRRGWLAAATLVTIAAAIGMSVWGWYDTATPRSIYSGAFAYDRFSLLVNVIILASTAAVVVISPGYLNRRGLHFGEYYALLLAATAGMMLLGGASSLMILFLAIELLSISLYLLSGFAREEERSQEAGMKYLLLGSFASAFLLFGMALIYGETGHTQLEQIAVAITNSTQNDPLIFAGIALIFIGLAFKISAAPFHTWSPDVYQGAPTSVTAYMSVTTKVAAFAAIVRLFGYTFSDPGGVLFARWSWLVGLVAIFSMVIGNVGALGQRSIKRLLAYSGIAQAGYILIGVAALDSLSGTATAPRTDATAAILYYLAAYAVTNIGAFAVVTVMSGRGEDLDSYDSLRGLAFRRPVMAALMGLFLLSLGGFPLTAGFFGKFFIFRSAIEANELGLAMWGIATSIIATFYYLRVALIMYTRSSDDEVAYAWPRASFAGGTMVALCGAGTVVLGVFVTLLYQVVTAAQQGLIPPAS